MSRTTALIVTCLLTASPSSADVRLFLIPTETITDARGTKITPKYLTADPLARWPFIPSSGFASMRNGLEDWALVRADVDASSLAALQKASDVVVFPADPTTEVPGPGLKVLATWLTNANLPNDWVVPGITVGYVERSLRGMFLLNQRIKGIIGDRVIKGGINLQTTLADLPPAARQALRQAADDLKFGKGRMNADDTLRDLYLDIADQQRKRPAERARIELNP